MPDATAATEMADRVTTLRNQANRRRIRSEELRRELSETEAESVKLDHLADEYEAILSDTRG